MAYDTNKLNKVFAFLSVLFLVTVFWVFLDDYMRPWKAVQIEGMKIKREKLQKKILFVDVISGFSILSESIWRSEKPQTNYKYILPFSRTKLAKKMISKKCWRKYGKMEE